MLININMIIFDTDNIHNTTLRVPPPLQSVSPPASILFGHRLSVWSVRRSPLSVKLVLTVDLAVDGPGSCSLLADREGKRLARLMLRTDLMP